MTKTEDRFAIISGRLRGARELHKLSAHETAIRAGVSDEEYNSWENGHPELSMEKMKKLADFYQVNVLFLLGKDFTVKVPYTKWLDDGAREDRNRCGVNDPYKRDYFDARYGAPIFVFDPETDRQESEMLDAFRKLDMYDRNFILSKALELLEKQGTGR